MADTLLHHGTDDALPPEVTAAASKLSPRNAVRQAVSAISLAESDGAFRTLLDALDPKHKHRLRERIVSALALPWLAGSPDRRAQAIHALASAARQPHLLGSRLTTGRAGKAFTAVGVMLPSILLLCGALSFALYALDLPYQFLVVPLVTAFIGTAVVGVVSGAISLSKEQSARLVVASLDGLGHLRAIEALSAVVDQLHFPTTTPVQPAARRAIEAIAPSVTSDHYGGVPKPALSALCRQRSLLGNVDVVRMLGAAGGAEVLPTLERLARASRSGPASEAAERLLPIVRERARRERDEAILLRPVSRPCDDTLVRPAGGVQGDPDLLLRPAEGDGSEQ